MSNPMRKKAKSIGPREVYVTDDVWAIIKQFVVDYAYMHRTKMTSVMSELSHFFAVSRRKYFNNPIYGTLICVNGRVLTHTPLPPDCSFFDLINTVDLGYYPSLWAT